MGLMHPWDIKDLGTISADEVGRIGERLPDPSPFGPDMDWDAFTLDQAIEVVRAARRMMAIHALSMEYHEHWFDDCGDYMEAATENWHRLWNIVFRTDGQEAAVILGVKEFLLEPPSEWLATDGEIRFSLFSEDYIEEHQD